MSDRQLARSTALRRRRLALVVLGAVALAVLLLLTSGGSDRRLVPGGGSDDDSFDPLAFRDSAAPGLERAAAAGLSHVLYTKSPDGVVASARRTIRWRPEVEAAAARYEVAPDVLEAIVFLESAGRPDIVAGNDPKAASGLTQILAETATNLLGLRIDLEESRRLTGLIHAAEHQGENSDLTRLHRDRRRIDERFDPAKALAATGRYISIARQRFGRADLAVASYHMGIGNLEAVLRLYADDTEGSIADVVEDNDLSYARLYFDSTPLLHSSAFGKLAAFGDDSATYLWRLMAAREIVRLYRSSPEQLARIERLHKGRPSAEQALHPPESTDVFEDTGELREARSTRRLLPLPAEASSTVSFDERMGELAAELGEAPALYRALRPQALALLRYLALGVESISGGDGPLIVGQAVQDRAYQDLIAESSKEAKRRYSVHTTGYAFDVLRRYRSPAQGQAFQFWLDRLQAMNLIAWSRDSSVIHITVSRDADVLVPVMLGQDPSP